MKESESIKLLRERSAGDNIFDAERQVFSKNSDGTIKKSVIKETYARVTRQDKRENLLMMSLFQRDFRICPNKKGNEDELHS